MPSVSQHHLLAAFAAAIALPGCSASGGEGADNPSSEGAERTPSPTTVTSASAVDWPDGFGPGDVYPVAGGTCRRLGEAEKTANWLDHDHILIGCPTVIDSATELKDDSDLDAALGCFGGTFHETIDGISLISLPAANGQRSAPDRAVGVVHRKFGGKIVGGSAESRTFRVEEGQEFSVSLDSNSPTAYFNILPPKGQASDTIYVGSMAIDRAPFSATANRTGDYSALVYLMGDDDANRRVREWRLDACLWE